MSRDHDLLQGELEELRRVREELSLQAHLGRMEARDLWADLEERFYALELKAKRLTRDPEDSLEDVGDAIVGALEELREGYDRLRVKLAEASSTGGLWGRFRSTFERLVGGGYKATERVVDSFGELGDAAKLRVEKARLERALFKKFAELGTRVYELAKQTALPDETPPAVPDDDKVKTLLQDVGSLDADLKKVVAELSPHEDPET
jgi:hypothetical protein